MEAFSIPFNHQTLSLLLSSLLLMAIISFIYLVRCSPKHKDGKFRKQLPPGPKPWPIVGNLPEMLTNKPAFKWILKLMNDLHTEIACIRLGNVNVISVTCPLISSEFLKKQDAVFASRPISMSSHLISSGYLTTILVPFGEQWKKMRKIVTHELLSPQKLQWLYDKRVEEADNLVQFVYNQCRDLDKSGLINVRITTQHYCGNVIRKLIFSKRYFGKGSGDGGPGYEEVEHVGSIFILLKYVYAFSVSDYLPCLRELDLDGHKSFLEKAMETIKKYHDPIIEDRIQQWKVGRKKDVEDWLDVLITLKDSNGHSLLAAEEIKAQIIELLIATVDNPSNAVEWAIAEMINQPEILKKAVKELDKVVGKGRQVQESDFPKLHFIKACAREAFRLHPIDPFLPPHVCMSDTIIANYFIPEGSHVLLSRSGLGRNPKVWDEPLKFKPERHLNNDGSDSDIVLAQHDLRFISFSTGRRGCPGATLGSMMTVMLLARLLHGFTWNLPPNKFSVDLTESMDATTLANPLVALASPRLPIKLYST